VLDYPVPIQRDYRWKAMIGPDLLNGSHQFLKAGSRERSGPGRLLRMQNRHRPVATRHLPAHPLYGAY
jgi:hypothetical protein